MDETYIKVKGKWVYYYRAVDKFGNVIDYYLSPKRDEAAAKVFLNKAISQNGLPSKVIIDGSKSNYAAIDPMNVQLWLTGYFMLSLVEILDIKYLNNIVEQSSPLGETKNTSSSRLEVNGRSLGQFAWA